MARYHVVDKRGGEIVSRHNTLENAEKSQQRYNGFMERKFGQFDVAVVEHTSTCRCDDCLERFVS